MTPLALVRSLGSLAASINAEHESAERAAMTAVDHARRAGALLIDAKAQLAHGEWLPWLAERCPTISVRKAQGYMKLAKANAQRVAHLSLREALALLSVPRDREAGEPLCGDEETVAISELSADAGWHYDDPQIAAKFETSLRRFGQINALLVRTAPDGRMVLIDGRHRLNALRAIGARTVRVRNVGEMSEAEATQLQLSAELDTETNYGAIVSQVAELVKGGATPEDLAAIGPLTAERIRHFVTLSTLDWSVFRAGAEGAADDPVPEHAFRCPCCAHEWSGNRRPPRKDGDR